MYWKKNVESLCEEYPFSKIIHLPDFSVQPDQSKVCHHIRCKKLYCSCLSAVRNNVCDAVMYWRMCSNDGYYGNFVWSDLIKCLKILGVGWFRTIHCLTSIGFKKYKILKILYPYSHWISNFVVPLILNFFHIQIWICNLFDWLTE